MSSSWMLWMFFSLLTGRPLLSLVLVVVTLWSMDRFTLQVLPSPLRSFKRWQRAGELAGAILTNPHDRRSRAELADIRVGQKRYAEAVDILKPNLDAGDDDVDTLFLLGVAYLGAGDARRGELLLDEAARQNESYRQGAIDLERGRFRLERGDAKGAQEALTRFLQARQGTVEGRWLLSRALALQGNADAAADMREEAWREYSVAPRFQRRRERGWAWRANPRRPALYAVLALVALGAGIYVSRHYVPPAPNGGYGMNRYAGDSADESGAED
ncbi:hypothetical protein KRR26_26005 [Corallococcus sp. M34]|uniref:tetratricopeptide repeat protein n=1 Tax=Citreicoccus inhibens TaxID=2849499 RepID=UPI001C212555|nr:hypothetical protein [Citreicoccus inhibens]MBU8899071.1 hypothetical protein [Citreicoccus inhibens]